MNSCQRWTPVLLATVLFAVQPTTSNAETRSTTIGVAQSITPSAEGSVGAVFQTLATGSELHAMRRFAPETPAKRTWYLSTATI